MGQDKSINISAGVWVRHDVRDEAPWQSLPAPILKYQFARLPWHVLLQSIIADETL